MSRTRWWLIAGLILGVGILLRTVYLGAVPASLYWDEAAMLVDVKSVTQSGQDMHGRPWFQLIYPSYGDFKLPVYLWLASGVSLVVGVSDWSLRLPSVLAGMVTILVVGGIAHQVVLISEKAGSKKVPESTRWWAQVLQLSVMGVVALAPWSILFSRTAFEGHVGQALMALSVWCILKSARRWWWILLAATCGIFATYAYFSVRFVWPVVVVSWLAWIWWQQVRPNFTCSSLSQFLGVRVVVALVIFGLGLIPMLRSPLYADSNAFRLGTDSVLNNEEQIITSNLYRELAGNTALDRVIFHRWWLTFKELLINYSDHLSFSYLFVTGDANLRHSTTEHGLFLLPFALSFGIGVLALAIHRRGLLAVLIIWWLSALLPASVPETTPHALRSLNALVPLSLIIGWGVATLIRQVWLSWADAVREATLPPLIRAWVLTVAVTVYGIWVGLATGAFALHYFKVYPVESAPEWQQGYREVAEAIERFRTDEDYPVVVLPLDDRFYLWVMAYGPYTATEFHQWSSQQWQFKSFDDIDFSGQGRWQDVLASQRQVVLVGRSEDVRRTLTEAELEPVYQESILDARGLDLYTVALLKE